MNGSRIALEELSGRAVNALSRLKVTTWQQLAELDRRDVLGLYNAGRRTVEELSDALALRDLHFADLHSRRVYAANEIPRMLRQREALLAQLAELDVRIGRALRQLPLPHTTEGDS